MGNRGAGGAGRFELSKVVFYVLLVSGSLGLAFDSGLRAGAQKTAAFHFVEGLKSTIADSLRLTAEEAPTLSRVRPVHFLQPNRYQGAGVTVNHAANDPNDLILLSGFFADTNELRLIRRTGEILARWPVSFHDLFPQKDHLRDGPAPATDWNIDTHGALALPDGSVVFNFEYGGLVKLDRCGRVMWTLPRRTHHSVERAEAGGFWALSRRMATGKSPFPPFETPFKEDTVLRISDDGRVLSEASVPRILYDNGLEALLTATGSYFTHGMKWDQEIVHANKVTELTSDLADDFPMFEAGDLAISIRELNLVMVVDRAAAKVKWWKVGPWLRQHDPEFKPGGTIAVFNNNTYETAFSAGDAHLGIGDQRTPLSTRAVSNVIEIDPATDMSQIIYGGRDGQELLSIIRGKVDITPKAGLFITEAEGGRVLETDAAANVVWAYVNRYSDTDVAEINEARLYPPSYFRVGDWSCHERPSK